MNSPDPQGNCEIALRCASKKEGNYLRWEVVGERKKVVTNLVMGRMTGVMRRPVVSSGYGCQVLDGEFCQCVTSTAATTT